MDAPSERPYLGCHFRVDLGGADSGSAAGGFAEVIFPSFSVEASDPACACPPNPNLVLKRGVTGSTELYRWWNKARAGKAPQRRSVLVELLGDDLSTVVVSWRFRNARPVRLSYSPLRALEPSVVIETIELAFDALEMR